MQLIIKLAISVAVILAATGIARKFPSIAGLISVMPLAGALIMAFVYYENRGQWQVMQGFTKGALWGILPSILFYCVAFFCLKKELSLAAVLASSFGAWFVAALIHQWALK
ncbi:MAG: putative rane protein [Deltaproteobacteria bacterium]|nr:putative rane protein [Deltaproteobacteria bacterium]